MRIVIITPVGPGHQHVVARAARSVHAQRAVPGVEIKHLIIDDQRGEGRSLARNRAMDMEPDADWYFFLDADDELARDAAIKLRYALRAHPEAKAIFGEVAGYTKKGVNVDFPNVYPDGWDELMACEVDQGLFGVGLFFEAQAARALRFQEDNDTTESFEFCMATAAAHPWVKVPSKFYMIHQDTPSATGPRGYTELDWFAEIRPLFEFWRARGRVPVTLEERRGKYWLPA